MRSGVGARMLRVDLEAVGIDVVTNQGKADFHSLRHTFCTLLARSGVQPQIAQKLMRHSSIDLTMNFYTHILMEDNMSAVSQLPDLWNSRDSNTGTSIGFYKG